MAGLTSHIVRVLRESHGLDESVVAARANLGSVERLRGIEAGTVEPRARDILGLARVFNVPKEAIAPLPTPGLDNLPEWQRLREQLHQHGEHHGLSDVQAYLVVMLLAWERELRELKRRGKLA